MTIFIKTAIGTLQVECIDKFIIGIAKVESHVESGDKVEFRGSGTGQEVLGREITGKESTFESVKKQEVLGREITEKEVFVREITKQLVEYFDGKRKGFELEIKLDGTAFQKKVWGELLKIPYGETITYAELAERVGSPRASRAVGNANGKNKILIVVPCHRVVAKGGIGGFACGIDAKKTLLELERRNK